MKESKLTSSLGRTGLIDLHFLEHRAKLIDIAAFLDRLDRAGDAEKSEDFRIKAFRKASAVLLDRDPDKARRILEVFSDHLRTWRIQHRNQKEQQGRHGRK